MNEFFAAWGIKSLPVAVAGAVGGAMSLRHFPLLSRFEKLSVISGSLFLAGYVAFPAAEWFKAESMVFVIAIGIGYFGLMILTKTGEIINKVDWPDMAKDIIKSCWPWGRK